MSSSPPEEKSRRPHDTAFKQQRLKAWQPILTPTCVITTFLVIAVIFVSLGAGILVASSNVIDAGPYRYDDDGDNSTYVTFRWPEDTGKKVYVYYQLSNFYQNHRRYVKSRSDIQLAGSGESDVQTLGDCDPWEYFSDHTPSNIDQIDTGGAQLNQIKLNPCGLIANSQFNDTFMMFDGACVSADNCSSLSSIDWTKKGIAWSSDREKKFKNYNGFDGTPTVLQQKDIEDEEFVVWMRTAGLPTFKKLHRIIHGGLQAGEYTMRIEQNFPVDSFDGRKAFYLTTTTWIGGKNEFLGWAYVSVGVLCVVLAFLFLLKHKLAPRDVTATKDK